MYEIGREDPLATFDEMLPLYLAHYEEMRARLAEVGIAFGPPAFSIAAYEARRVAGAFIHIVARKDGEAVGYANAFLGKNRHNGELEATEDAVFVAPEHRGRAGIRLMSALRDEAAASGARRLYAMDTTDPRAEALYRRMGFAPAARVMALEFGDRPCA